MNGRDKIGCPVAMLHYSQAEGPLRLVWPTSLRQVPASPLRPVQPATDAFRSAPQPFSPRFLRPGASPPVAGLDAHMINRGAERDTQNRGGGRAASRLCVGPVTQWVRTNKLLIALVNTSMCFFESQLFREELLDRGREATQHLF